MINQIKNISKPFSQENQETDLKIMTRQLPNQIVSISIKGVVDNYTHAQVEQVINWLSEQGIYKLIVDLSQVDYISCKGTGVLVGALGEARENKGDIVIFRPSPCVTEVFDLLRLTVVFTITDDMDEALAALDSLSYPTLFHSYGVATNSLPVNGQPSGARNGQGLVCC